MAVNELERYGISFKPYIITVIYQKCPQTLVFNKQNGKVSRFRIYFESDTGN